MKKEWSNPMKELKTMFIQLHLQYFSLTENAKQQVIENILMKWKTDFDVFIMDGLVPTLAMNDIEPALAFQIMNHIRNGLELPLEWKRELKEKGIPDEFLVAFTNQTLYTALRQEFEELLLSQIQQAQE